MEDFKLFFKILDPQGNTIKKETYFGSNLNRIFSQTLILLINYGYSVSKIKLNQFTYDKIKKYNSSYNNENNNFENDLCDIIYIVDNFLKDDTIILESR